MWFLDFRHFLRSDSSRLLVKATHPMSHYRLLSVPALPSYKIVEVSQCFSRLPFGFSRKVQIN